ncbi:MAG: restriction endonuclease subunit S, partial [Tissierellia bacterium]|nr:restriction endonuclease subunit S [Tissierellia bacterium]
MAKWKKVKLEEYIDQIRGVSYSSKDVSNVETDTHVAILRANNIQDDGLNFTDLVYVDKRKIKENQYIKKGDILICASSGSKNLVGKAAQSNKDLEMSFGAFCKVVRTQKIYAPYLGYYFKSRKYRSLISNLSAGANINNMSLLQNSPFVEKENK